MDYFHHYVVSVHVGVVIPFRQVALGVVVCYEDIDALKEGAVLDYDIVTLGDFQHVVQALLQKVHLQCKGPALDVLVVVLKIRIVGDGLKLWSPSVVPGEQCGQSSFAAADVSCYSDVHNSTKFVKVY